MKYKTLWNAATAMAVTAATALFSLLPVIDAQPVAAANVIGLNLIQGNSNTVVVKLLNGTVVTLAPGASPNFSIDAVTTVPTSATTTIGSVQFSYNQKVNFRTETKAPYAMCGNYGTKYTKCHVLGVGKHSVAAKTSHTGSAWYRVNFEIAVANPAAAPIPVPVVVPTKAPVAATAPTTVALFTPIRINCGGGSYTDTMGHVWSADTFFSGGSVHTTNAAIANTDDDVLYQSERYGDATYSIPVLPASSSSPALYDVTLHMSEV
jgi:Malectin domain